MERLTYDFCLGHIHCWQVKGADNQECRQVCEEQEYGCKGCPIALAFDRLAAYEDTGFTPEEVQQMRWIPVEERFPEDRLPAGRKQITVMVATKAGKVTIASRVFEPEREYYGKKYPAKWVWSRWLNHYVTHWMPLPPGPSAKGEE